MAPTAPPAAPAAGELSKTQKRRMERKARKNRELSVIAAEVTAPSATPKPSATVRLNGKSKDALRARLAASKKAPVARTGMDVVGNDSPSASSSGAKKPTTSDLQQKMAEKLKGARFRWINERLYTASSDDAVAMFRDDPKMFVDYHTGFRAQVAYWPSNPVDVFIAELKAADKSLIVADMGCGEAAIAAAVPQKVHSFDLVAHNADVVACDIAHVPLKDESVDIAIFSLSLMGTNYIDFLREAHRILRRGGQLQIAEVASRFADLDGFVSSVVASGFKLLRRDESNNVFVRIDFEKKSKVFSRPDEAPELKPCLYKKR